MYTRVFFVFCLAFNLKVLFCAHFSARHVLPHSDLKGFISIRVYFHLFFVLFFINHNLSLLAILFFQFIAGNSYSGS